MDIFVQKESVCADEINWGDAFEIHGDYYMAMRPQPDNDSVPAVNLSTGSVTYFCKEEVVHPVSAKVLINGGDEE